MATFGLKIIAIDNRSIGFVEDEVPSQVINGEVVEVMPDASVANVQAMVTTFGSTHDGAYHANADNNISFTDITDGTTQVRGTRRGH